MPLITQYGSPPRLAIWMSRMPSMAVTPDHYDRLELVGRRRLDDRSFPLRPMTCNWLRAKLRSPVWIRTS
jgi:hypothetical protein